MVEDRFGWDSIEADSLRGWDNVVTFQCYLDPRSGTRFGILSWIPPIMLKVSSAVFLLPLLSTHSLPFLPLFPWPTLIFLMGIALPLEVCALPIAFPIVCVEFLTLCDIFMMMVIVMVCSLFQCFDTIGWVTGRASGLSLFVLTAIFQVNLG